MIRTQIYLPKPLYDDIKLRAQLAGKPAAEVIRELIATGVKAKQKQPDAHGALTALSELHITGGPSDLSSRIDDYLYGDER